MSLADRPAATSKLPATDGALSAGLMARIAHVEHVFVWTELASSSISRLCLSGECGAALMNERVEGETASHGLVTEKRGSGGHCSTYRRGLSA